MGARILVIEDNPANLQLMTYLLEAFGHTVVPAHSGEEGLERAAELPDLILCDMQLPGLDGFEVARALSQSRSLRALPLVAVTALAMVGDRERVLAEGFDGYLAKPIEPETFVQQVETFLRPGAHGLVPLRVPESGPGPPKAKPVRRASILMVDDSQVNIQFVRNILEPNGFEVLAAFDAVDAVELARRCQPNLILSDLHMPKEGGFDLIRVVKTDPLLRRIPFIFLSSSLQADLDSKKGLELGAVRFLQRPIEPEALLAGIEEELVKGANKKWLES